MAFQIHINFNSIHQKFMNTNYQQLKKQLSKLPYRNNAQDAASRKKIFSTFDMNNNGYLSLAQVDKAVRDVLKFPQLFKLKPVLLRAFQVAKSALKANNTYGDDYVSKTEFRFLLLYLVQYFQYWIIFNQIDTSNDRRISIEQFQLAVPILKKWGVSVDNVEEVFAQIDSNGGGLILFNQFCDWAINKNLFSLSEVEKNIN